MRYACVRKARFLDRPNRFIAQVELDGKTETVHVKNTGRCRELLIPGAVVYLSQSTNPGRKTRYDLIAVEKGARLINIDSQAPNAAVMEWLQAGNLYPAGTEIRAEYPCGGSRFDFALFTPALALLEVKGVTLEREGVVLFPDAPTVRGTKHIRGLTAFSGEAAVLFLIQMEHVRFFTPNRDTDPDFADALLAAREAGVQILAYDCLVSPEEMVLNRPVPVRL